MTPKKKGATREGKERRRHRRYDVKLHADVTTEDAFLFAYVSNISEVGIFLATDRPIAVGTLMKLRFRPMEGESFEVEGEVVWVNPVREKPEENLNPGMGIKFVNLDDATRERIVKLIRTIAYLHDHWV